MRLVRAELRRIRLRTVSWLVLGLLLVVGAGFVATAWDDARPPTAVERAAAHEAYESDVRMVADMTESCRAMLAKNPDENLDCDIEKPVEQTYVDAGRTFVQAATEATDGLAVPLAVAALVAAVSLVTAEFGARTMATWLVVAPRRTRVVLGKTAAATIASAPAAVFCVLATILGLAALYAGYGRPLGAIASPVLETLGRELVLVVLAVVAGTGLAFALRHVTAVLGVIVWWVIAVEVTLPIVLPRWTPVTIAANVRAWTEGGATYSYEQCAPDPADPLVPYCTDIERVVSAGQGAVALVIVALLLGMCGLLVFRHRDVT